MTKAFVYVVAENSNPDKLEDCSVPYLVNKETIFFGPCKKRLRELIKHSIEHMSEEDTYLIGLNGSNNKKIRKVIWAGKIKEVLTFVEAWERLRGESSYREMIKREYSPLHLRPILQRGNMIGYKQVSKMHIEEGKWILDIISSTKSKAIEIAKDFTSVVVRKGFIPNNVFNRDSCFIMENIFFAQNGGIEIDLDILKIFQASQKDRDDIDRYALFGRQSNGNADGKIGGWLELNDNSAKKLISILKTRSKNFKESKTSQVAIEKAHGC